MVRTHRYLVLLVVLFLSALPALAQCALPTTDKSVNICAPASGATVASPVQISASAKDTAANVTAMAVYIDGSKAYTASSTTQLSTALPIAAGTHKLTVKAWDSAAAVFSSTLNFTVGSAPPPSGCTATGANRTVTICSPVNNSTVPSPVHITAAAADTASVSSMQIYVDGVKQYQVAAKSIDTSLPMSSAAHKITVKAWDATGSFSAISYISISGSTTNPTVTMTANPSTITGGASSTLTITAQNASSVVVSNNVNSTTTTLPGSGGTVTVSPTTSTTYTATATGTSGGTATASATVTVSGGGGGSGDITAVNHVIFFLQENRSFDSYFGMINPYREAHGFTVSSDGNTYSVDGIDDKLTKFNYDDEGNAHYLFHTTSSCIDDLTSAWLESYGMVYRWNFSTTRPINMDGYVHIAENFAKSGSGSGTYSDKTGDRAMAYYRDSAPDGSPQLNYYYFMASQFAMSDRWFTPIASKTVPNRIATLSGGTTLGYTHDPANDDNAGQLTAKTIFQLLEEHGISWKIYYQQTNPDGTPTTEFSRFAYANNFIHKNADGSIFMDPKHIVPISQYFSDVANGTLPSFAYIQKKDGTDEHPGSGTSVYAGQQSTAKIINALMYSPSWKDSVFFFGFDEAGGPYDHVPPVPGHSNDFTTSTMKSLMGDVSPIAVNPDGYLPCVPTTAGVYNNHCDLRSNDPGAKSTDAAAQQGFAAQIGFRVPNMIISPFAKPHYVGHRAMDHTAVIRFLERRFGLPALTKRDAAQPDLNDFFDFTNPPWATPPAQSTLPTPPSVGSTCHPATLK